MSLLTNEMSDKTSLLTGIKDVDLKIFSELDDISLLNFCRLNESNEYIKKLCFDESFWRNRTINKYGVIEKNPTRTWRNFYLKLTYYDTKYLPNGAMRNAAKDGSKNLDLINFFINKGANDWNYGMAVAARGGHMELVKFFIDRGANEWNFGMAGAARGGHMHLVNFFIDNGAKNWNWGMRFAAEGGHMNLVQFFIDKGANDWNYGMMASAKGGHKDLVQFFIDKGAKDWRLGMRGAAEGGHKDVIQFFKNKMNK